MNIKKFWNDHSGIILTAGSCIGVVATSYLTSKCTTKYDKIMTQSNFADDEKCAKFCESLKIYSPAIISGGLTISCILLNHKTNEKKQKMLLAAYALAQESYNRVREATNKVCDTETIHKIQVEYAQEVYNHGYDPADVIVVDNSQERITFYDTATNSYFLSTVEMVQKAEGMFHEKFSITGKVSLNEWRTYLGLPIIQGHIFYDRNGWDVENNNHYIFISFAHTKIVIHGDTDDEELEVIMIEPSEDPDIMGV